MNKVINQKLLTIKGKIIDIRFVSEKNDFFVGILKLEETNEEITIVGSSLHEEIELHFEYQFKGNYVHNLQYGNQFRFLIYSKIVPTTKLNLIQFLINHQEFKKTIDLIAAQKLVNHFGIDLLKILYHNPSRIKELNFSSKKEKEITDIVTNYYQFLELEDSLLKMNLDLFIINKLKKLCNEFYHNNFLQRLTDDIFKLYWKGHLSFNEWKQLYKNLENKNELEKSKIIVFECIIKYCFDLSSTIINKNQIITKLQSILIKEQSEYNAVEIINNLEQDKKIVFIDDTYLMLDYYYRLEKIIYDKLTSLNDKNKLKDEIDFELSLLNALEPNIELAKEQKKAINNCILNPVSLISGGPGTGKTFIISLIVKLLQEKSPNDKLILISSTGRVAKRMGNITNLTGYTFHRFLNLDPNEKIRNFKPELNYDVKTIIIDEGSMVSSLHLGLLLESVPNLERIIILGDINQLQPIAEGSIFKDLIESKKYNITYLEKNYRQNQEDVIIPFAKEILKAKEKNLNANPFQYLNHQNLKFIKCENDEIKNRVVEIYQNEIKLNNQLNIQVLSPINKNLGSVDELNLTIQETFNFNKYIKLNKKETNFKKEDKVLFTENNLKLDLYNGDIGFLKDHWVEKKALSGIKKEQTIFQFIFNDQLKEIAQDELNIIKLGYAITIHKGQGSEFDVVIVSLPNITSRMLYNNLIYTAITRAKSKLYLIGSRNSLAKAINTIDPKNRETLLWYFNQKEINQLEKVKI